MTALVVAVLAVVAGLLRGPSPVTARLRSLQGQVPRLSLQLTPAPGTRAAVTVAAIGAAVVFGGWARLGYGVTVPFLPAIAGAVAGAATAAALGRAAADRARRRADTALAEAVGSLVADLRAGQQPGAAIEALAGPAARHRAVIAVWSVSQRSGAPAAAVLDRVEQDLRARRDQRREVAAALAGARSTGTLLAALPLLGIGLGAGMGAHPVTVLLGQPRGQVALVVGVVLEALGLVWTSRIITSAEGTR